VCRAMRGLAIAALVLLASPAHAGASIDFAPYDGPEIIEVGTGGTKVTKNGIDYWTSGTPPRRYRVIGQVRDKRDEEWDGGRAIGSPRIARIVIRAGGDAVILNAEAPAGQTGGAGVGKVFALGGSKTLTTFVAVRYLD
jgi:hypothetical protein